MKRNIIKVGILFMAMITFSIAEMKAQNNKKERPSYEELLEDMDADEDGKISKDEAKGPLNDHFDEIDKDEDGYITEEEFKNAPKPNGKKPPKRN
jgi:Ca2+-binding EF-hand superfamily protein